jgi:hypothetical protein
MRIALCPRSAVGSNMHGQPPSITVLPAIVGRRLGDAPGTGAAVHPHVLDAEVGALAHRLFGDLGPGCDHDRVDAAGDRAQVAVARIALDLVRVRVDGEDLVAPPPKALVHDVASVILRLSGDARDRHPLAGQKLPCGLFDLRHACSLLPEKRFHEAALGRARTATPYARPNYVLGGHSTKSRLSPGYDPTALGSLGSRTSACRGSRSARARLARGTGHDHHAPLVQRAPSRGPGSGSRWGLGCRWELWRHP